jgi:hypothetical protein
MARRPKAKAEAQKRLPPLTIEASTDWHKKKTLEEPAAMWSVNWDTTRQPDSCNAAYQKLDKRRRTAHEDF